MPTSKQIIRRHSYGLLCENYNPFIESIGAFCSFAEGVAVIHNHEIRLITTHPFVYAKYPKDHPACIEGFELDRNYKYEIRRTRIGNDVWLGRNGVIAGAGAVITKDVSDYAVVAGTPGRVIKYRYRPNQIDALNRIEWWNWSDEEIIERSNDFYLPIDEFIKKCDAS